MRPIVTCRNTKHGRLVMECNLAAMAHVYPKEYINEQYRELKREQIKKSA